MGYAYVSTLSETRTPPLQAVGLFCDFVQQSCSLLRTGNHSTDKLPYAILLFSCRHPFSICTAAK